MKLSSIITLATLAVIIIVAWGIVNQAFLMGGHMPHMSNCYDLLNAAGQVVGTSCH